MATARRARRRSGRSPLQRINFASLHPPQRHVRAAPAVKQHPHQQALQTKKR